MGVLGSAQALYRRIQLSGEPLGCSSGVGHAACYWRLVPRVVLGGLSPVEVIMIGDFGKTSMRTGSRSCHLMMANLRHRQWKECEATYKKLEAELLAACPPLEEASVPSAACPQVSAIP